MRNVCTRRHLTSPFAYGAQSQGMHSPAHVPDPQPDSCEAQAKIQDGEKRIADPLDDPRPAPPPRIVTLHTWTAQPGMGAHRLTKPSSTKKHHNAHLEFKRAAVQAACQSSLSSPGQTRQARSRLSPTEPPQLLVFRLCRFDPGINRVQHLADDLHRPARQLCEQLSGAPFIFDSTGHGWRCRADDRPGIEKWRHECSEMKLHYTEIDSKCGSLTNYITCTQDCPAADEFDYTSPA